MIGERFPYPNLIIFLVRVQHLPNFSTFWLRLPSDLLVESFPAFRTIDCGFPFEIWCSDRMNLTVWRLSDRVSQTHHETQETEYRAHKVSQVLSSPINNSPTFRLDTLFFGHFVDIKRILDIV